MAEASETHHTVGTNVAVGDNNTMNVTYNGLPQIPPDLPPGSEVYFTCKVVIGDQSGAAHGEEQPQPEPQHQVPQQRSSQQRPQSPPRKRPTQQQQQQQQQHEQHPQQPEGSRNQQQISQQNQVQPSSGSQSSIPGQSVGQPQQETSPPGQHPSSGQGQSLGQQGTGQPVPKFTSQASYTGDPSSGLPYSLNPVSDYPAMPLQLQATSGNTGSHVEESCQNDVGYRSPIHRSFTHPGSDQNTIVKRPNSPTRSVSVCDSATHCGQSSNQDFPYSLNPSDCPTEPCPESLKTSLRVLPKSGRCSSQLSTISASTDKDAKSPELTDIIVITISSQLVLIVSDMANSCIKVVKNIQDAHKKIECLTLTSPPTSLSRFKRDNILVGCYQEMQFIIVHIGQMTILETIKTARQYTGFDAISDTTLAACSRGSVDVIDHKGNLLKSHSLTNFNSPCYISASSRIYVTDSMANTLTCLDHQGQMKYSVSAAEISKVSVLRGLVQSGSDVLVADDVGERILSFADSGKSVKVVLDKKNGISKPCGLCIHGNSLYIAEKGGAIRVWKMADITSIRL